MRIQTSSQFRTLSKLFILTLLGGFAALSLSNCATRNDHRPEALQKELFAEKPVKVQSGKASYYYGRWIGRKTANGEIYRKNDVTAAHKYLPFGSYVCVHNLRNQRSIIVRINNRGPYIRGRIIDLSLRAADHLDMRKAGVVPVRIEVLDPIADKSLITRYINEQQFSDEL